MKCPLSIIDWPSNIQGRDDMLKDCLKEECAWWRDDISMCAVKDLSLEAGYTQQRLGELNDIVKERL